MVKSMVSGKEWKLILLFTLPLMAGNLLQQLYNTVDGIIVGNYVGADALASVGTCTPMTMLFIALAMGLSTGCSIVVSQYFGANQLDEMRRSVSTAILMLVTLGLVLSVVGVIAARPLLQQVLNVDPRYLEDAVCYFSIYAVGLVFQFTYNIFAAVLRSLGDSGATLYFLLASSVTNVFLDLLFVRVFYWGVARRGRGHGHLPGCVRCGLRDLYVPQISYPPLSEGRVRVPLGQIPSLSPPGDSHHAPAVCGFLRPYGHSAAHQYL